MALLGVASATWAAQMALPGVATARGFWLAAGGFALGFVGLWAAAYAALALLAPSSSGSAAPGTLCGVRRGTWALKAMMLCHHSVVGPLALLALLQDRGARQAVLCLGCEEAAALLARDPEGPSLAAQALVPVTIGYMAADLLLVSQWSLVKTGRVENALMGLHHFLSMCSWPVTLYFDYCSRYILFLLSYEVTSVFLIVNWMLSTAGMKKSSFYFASGLLFTASFVLLRLVGGVPQIFSMYTVPPVWHEPVQRDVPSWALWNGFIWLMLPHVLNVFWGVKVIQGFLAVALGKGKKKEDKD